MSTTEFERGASGWRRLRSLDRTAAVTAACRGSGNPALLAWLAEALELDGGTRIVDVGGGLGGPCAWLHDHYGADAVTIDPVADAVRGAGEVFGVPGAAAGGESLPFADGTFDVALLLGVVSVVDDPMAVLDEAGRVAARLGVIAYCSTGPEPVEVGGSHFQPRDRLLEHLTAAGWHVDAGPEEPGIPPPPTWDDGTDGEAGPPSDHDEQEVGAAIAEGRVEAVVATARRA